MRAIVGGLGGAALVLVGIWVAVSWRALSGGTGERAEMSWYDPITWTTFVVLVVFLAVQALIGLATLERRLAVWGLVPSGKEVLRRRVEQLSRTRAEVLEAVDDERRRIERDVHDGVQQRLVALGMLLGRAQRLDDSGAAASLFRQAQEESRRALEELREVAWRIYPVALDDGGLPAALESLVDRSSVPIVLDYDVPVRPCSRPRPPGSPPPKAAIPPISAWPGCTPSTSSCLARSPVCWTAGTNSPTDPAPLRPPPAFMYVSQRWSRPSRVPLPRFSARLAYVGCHRNTAETGRRLR
ncbi:sensor histidine kinase [Streptosporangium roseum]|nr:histidine kinase [Streptosporangium roseum]